VLHSIDFCPYFSPPILLCGIQGIPIKELALAAKDKYPDILTTRTQGNGNNQAKIQGHDRDNNNKTAVSTLYSSMAYDTLQQDLVKRTDLNYRSVKNDISGHRAAAEGEIRGAYFDIRANIFKSEEAEMIRLMQLATDTMRNGLELKRRCSENRAKAVVEEIKTSYYATGDRTKESLVENQASIYKQHLEFAQTHGMLSSGRHYEGTRLFDNQETAYGEYALCTFTDYRKSFCPGKLP